MGVGFGPCPRETRTATPGRIDPSRRSARRPAGPRPARRRGRRSPRARWSWVLTPSGRCDGSSASGMCRGFDWGCGLALAGGPSSVSGLVSKYWPTSLPPIGNLPTAGPTICPRFVRSWPPPVLTYSHQQYRLPLAILLGNASFCLLRSEGSNARRRLLVGNGSTAHGRRGLNGVRSTLRCDVRNADAFGVVKRQRRSSRPLRWSVPWWRDRHPSPIGRLSRRARESGALARTGGRRIRRRRRAVRSRTGRMASEVCSFGLHYGPVGA